MIWCIVCVHVPLRILAALPLPPATGETTSSVQASVSFMHKQPGSVLLQPVSHPLISLFVASLRLHHGTAWHSIPTWTAQNAKELTPEATIH